MKMYKFVHIMKLLTIGQVAKILGVSTQTLRRWDNSGKLNPTSQKNHRRYLKDDIGDYIRENIKELNLFKIARNWATSNLGTEPFLDFYCPNISIFQMRLAKLESELGKVEKLNRIFPLISAITGEIGNNSFDHNLGNWQDILGIFFAWDLNKGKIVLADRGQGILTTLKKVRPKLTNHRDALWIAFNEIVSGRSPEYRGNGLKFVKEVVAKNKIKLSFYTGNACLKIKKNTPDIVIEKSTFNLQGCLALIEF